MAKVILMAGIISLRGKLGNYCYRTYKNGTIVMSRLPKASKKAPSEAQKRQQERFAAVMRQVSKIRRDTEQCKAMEVLYRRYGKKQEMFSSFLFRMVNKTLEECVCEQ